MPRSGFSALQRDHLTSHLLQLAGRLLRIPAGTKKACGKEHRSPNRTSPLPRCLNDAPTSRSARWRRALAAPRQTCAYPRPARRERKSRPRKAGRRARAGRRRSSFCAGGSASGATDPPVEAAKRPASLEGLKQERPRGGRMSVALFSLPAPPVPLRESAQGGGGIDKAAAPWRRAGPRAIRRGDLEAGGACAGWSRVCADLFCGRCSCSAAPDCWCARTRARRDASPPEVRSPVSTLLAGPRLAQIAGSCGRRASPSHLNDFVACGRA